MKTNKLIAVAVLMLVFIVLISSHFLFPENRDMVMDGTVNLGNLILLLYIFFNYQPGRTMPNSMVLYFAIAYTALKGITLFFMPPFTGSKEASLGIIDYTPFFILIAAATIIYYHKGCPGKDAI